MWLKEKVPVRRTRSPTTTLMTGVEEGAGTKETDNMKNPNGNAWDRLPNETAEHYGYFREFLLMTPVRRLETVAQTVQKSPSHIRSLASKYDWKDRAAKFDSSLMDAARETIRRRLPEVLTRQWNNCVEIASKVVTELLQRDLSKASYKSLNELLAISLSQSQKSAEVLDALNDTHKNGEMTINIVRAGD